MSTFDRRTGKTSRIIWQALLEASRGGKVAIVMPTEARARWTFNYLLEFAKPIEDIDARWHDKKLTLPGGGSISVIAQSRSPFVEQRRGYTETYADD